MPSKTDIANAALDKIGAVPIADINSNASPVERACSRNFEMAVREAGERIPWRCLKASASLTQSGTPPLRWGYSYALPANFLRVNTFNQATINEQLNDFFETDRRYLFTDEDEAYIEYNEYHENTGLYTPNFVEAVAWSLAVKIAPTVTGGVSDMEALMAGFEKAIGKAGSVDGHQVRKHDTIQQVLQGSRLVGARRFSTNG